MTTKAIQIKAFNIKKSIRKEGRQNATQRNFELMIGDKTFTWSTPMERIQVIRKGIPYQSIEVISKRMKLPIKAVLATVKIPQTTYNKNKNKNLVLDVHHSELITLLTELIDYALEVFNNEEEKLQRWFDKPNYSLGGKTPKSLLDTTTGVQQVKNCLHRIEFGNFA